jgi:enoyl-CoA hydratase
MPEDQPEYKYIQYEQLEAGRVVRIMLDRPDTRNAQNRGLLVELDDAFRRAEEDDEVRVVILGGTGPLFSSGHDMGSAQAIEDRTTHPTSTINGATREGAEARMLQEWHYYFQNTLRWRNLRKITIAQVQGTVFAAGPHRGGRERPVRRRGGHEAGNVRRRVLRPSLGVRSPQGQRAHVDR